MPHFYEVRFVVKYLIFDEKMKKHSGSSFLGLLPPFLNVHKS